MDYSVFYYAYSTIAQTLAGAFGFLVAVVLYRIQSIESGIPAKVDMFAGTYGETDAQFHRWVRLKEWDKMLSHVRSYKGDFVGVTINEAGRSIVGEMVAAFEADMEKLSSVRRGLLRSLYPTGAAIGLCLVFMPLTNECVISNVIWAGAILAVVTGLALYCLWTFIGLVKDVAR